MAIGLPSLRRGETPLPTVRLGVELSRRSEWSRPTLYADGTRFPVQRTLSLAGCHSRLQAIVVGAIVRSPGDDDERSDGRAGGWSSAQPTTCDLVWPLAIVLSEFRGGTLAWPIHPVQKGTDRFAAKRTTKESTPREDESGSLETRPANWDAVYAAPIALAERSKC